MSVKVLLIIGNELRHKFFASTISRELDVVGIVYEKKANVHEKFDYSGEDKKIVKKHFEDRGEYEKKYFRDYAECTVSPSITVDTGEANSQEVLEWIINKAPQFILLFGSSIIKEHILDAFDQRVINLHLGLSPYYRGSGTNFWALVDKMPECVGATMHLAVSNVDAGGILKQVRPDLKIDDCLHDVGNKVILKAAGELTETVFQYSKGVRKPILQDLSKGKVCKRKDLDADSIVKANQNIDHGMVADYLKDKESRELNYPIIK